MAKKTRSDYTPRPDRERRKIQASRVCEILMVHRLSNGTDVTVERCSEIAKAIGRSERTVWRHLATLKHVYDTMGTSLLDG